MYKIEAKDSKNTASNLEYIEPEIWKDIEGYEGWYQVSNRGRVRSWHYKGNGSLKGSRRSNEPTILSLPKVHGYEVVGLAPNTSIKHRVHILVAKAFIPNPENKPYVCHKDDVRDNNYVGNLYWGDGYDNMSDRRKNNHMNEGENCAMSKLTDQKVLEMRNAYRLGCFTFTEIGNAYNVSRRTAARAIKGETWKHI